MGGYLGAGFAQGLASGIQTGVAQSVAAQQFAERRELLKQQQKKLKLYEEAYANLTKDDPELATAIPLGLHEDLLKKRRQAEGLKQFQDLVQGVGPATTTTDPITGKSVKEQTLPPSSSIRTIGPWPTQAPSRGLGAAFEGAPEVSSQTGLDAILADPAKAMAAQQALAEGGIDIDITKFRSAKPEGQDVPFENEQGPWVMRMWFNPRTGQAESAGPPQRPSWWFEPVPSSELAGTGLPRGTTRGQLYSAGRGAAAPTLGATPPAVPGAPRQGLPATPPRLTVPSSEEQAALNERAKVEAEEANKTLTADERNKYTMSDGSPLQVSIQTVRGLRDAMSTGMVRAKEVSKAGETEKKLAVLIPATLAAVDEMQSLLWPEDQGETFQAGLLRTSGLIPTEGLTGRAVEAFDAFPAARRVLQLQGMLQEPVGRLLSGGVISAQEEKRFIKSYVPRMGDGDKVAWKKLEALRQIYAQIQSSGDPESMTFEQKVALRKAMGFDPNKVPPTEKRGAGLIWDGKAWVPKE